MHRLPEFQFRGRYRSILSGERARDIGKARVEPTVKETRRWATKIARQLARKRSAYRHYYWQDTSSKTGSGHNLLQKKSSLSHLLLRVWPVCIRRDRPIAAGLFVYSSFDRSCDSSWRLDTSWKLRVFPSPTIVIG